MKRIISLLALYSVACSMSSPSDLQNSADMQTAEDPFLTCDTPSLAQPDITSYRTTIDECAHTLLLGGNGINYGALATEIACSVDQNWCHEDTVLLDPTLLYEKSDNGSQASLVRQVLDCRFAPPRKSAKQYEECLSKNETSDDMCYLAFQTALKDWDQLTSSCQVNDIDEHLSLYLRSMVCTAIRGNVPGLVTTGADEDVEFTNEINRRINVLFACPATQGDVL
ncbi:MAG: hypothetical protein IPJ88_08455 [Myxococcales bacterium]|nr:MAG: hypothetical protein IPJ88_08455 [Myxococcales bacterium]